MSATAILGYLEELKKEKKRKKCPQSLSFELLCFVCFHGQKIGSNLVPKLGYVDTLNTLSRTCRRYLDVIK